MKLGLLVSSALTGVVLAGSAQAQVVPVATEPAAGVIKIEYKDGALSGLNKASTQGAVTTAGPGLSAQDVADAAKVQVFIGDLTGGGSATLYSGALLASSGTFAKAVEVTYSGKINPDDSADLTIVGRYGASANATDGVAAYDPANPGAVTAVTAAILAQNTLTFTNSGYMRKLASGPAGDLAVSNFGGLITVNNSGLMDGATIKASFGGVKLTNTGEMDAVKVGRASGGTAAEDVFGTIDITNEKLMDAVEVNAYVATTGADTDYSGTATAVSTSKLGAVKVANSGAIIGAVKAISPLTIDITNATTGTIGGGILATAGGAITIDSKGASGAIVAVSDGDWAPADAAWTGGTRPTTLLQRAGAAVTVTAANSGGVFATSASQKTEVTVTPTSGPATKTTNITGGGKVTVSAGNSIGDIVALSAGGASVTITGAVQTAATTPLKKDVYVGADGVESTVLVGAGGPGSTRTITRDGGTASLVVEATGSMINAPTSGADASAVVATLGDADATIKGKIGNLFVVSASDALKATYSSTNGLQVVEDDAAQAVLVNASSGALTFHSSLGITSTRFGLKSDEAAAVAIPSATNTTGNTT